MSCLSAGMPRCDSPLTDPDAVRAAMQTDGNDMEGTRTPSETEMGGGASRSQLVDRRELSMCQTGRMVPSLHRA